MITNLIKHKDLILQLDQLYPLRNSSPADTLDKIRFDAGRRDVVEFLLRALKDEEEQAEDFQPLLNGE